MIDVEFYTEKAIRDSWNLYRDHLNTPSKRDTTEAIERWCEKGDEYFTDLLYCMSKYFDYGFDKVILKKGAYSPQAHGNFQMETAEIRKELIKLLKGETSLNVNADSEKTTNK